MRRELKNRRDWIIGRLADRQHGVVGRRQLRDAGLTDAAISRSIGAGRLRPLMRGVYAVGHLAVTHHGWCQAALLATGPEVAISHESAAQLWRLRFRDESLPVDVIGPRQAGRGHRRISARQIQLRQFEVVKLDGLQVTSDARTIVDLAGTLTTRELRLVVERAQDSRVFSAKRIERVLGERTRAPGCGPLRDLIQLLSADADGARSYLEQLVMRTVRAHRLPRPKLNEPILGKRRDFVWPAARLVLEADGHRYHSSRGARRRDNRRDRELLAHGWRTVRFTYEEVTLEPDVLVADLRRFLAPVVSSGRRPTRTHDGGRRPR